MRIQIFTIMLLALAACGAKDNNTEALQNILIQGPWTSMDYLTDKTGTGNFVSQYGPCDRDNVWDFKTAGTYTYDDGPTSCDPSDPLEDVPGKWELRQNETVLYLSVGGDIAVDEMEAQVLSYGPNELQLLLISNSLPKEKIILYR